MGGFRGLVSMGVVYFMLAFAVVLWVCLFLRLGLLAVVVYCLLLVGVDVDLVRGYCY